MVTQKKSGKSTKTARASRNPHEGKENMWEAANWIELARYGNVVGNDAVRGTRLTSSLDFATASSYAEWRHLAQFIEPSRPLTRDNLKRSNPEVQIEALVQSRALDALLRLTGASDALRSNLQVLLSSLQPKGAEQKAQAQEEALRPRGRRRHAIAKDAGYDPSEFNKEVSRGGIALLDLEE
jgi:hypothetical protein